MITIPLDPTLIPGARLGPGRHGLALHRLPDWVGVRCPDPRLLEMERQPSGLRLALDTEARAIRLVLHTSRTAYRGASRPRGALDVCVDDVLHRSETLTGGDTLEIGFDGSAPTLIEGPGHTLDVGDLPAGPKTIEIWLPHNEAVEIISLQADAPVRPAHVERPVWLHHGSSISHGSNAATPTQIWPVITARTAGVELRNLGFGGSCMIDPFMARVVRDQPADLISLKLGINVVNGDVMRLRAFVPAVHGFLDTIRDGHPDTPVIVISPIHCPVHEDTPGPGTVDVAALAAGHVRFGASGDPADVAAGRLTLGVIRDLLATLVSDRSDAQLVHLDGTTLYGPDDAVDHPLPDNLHPDAATHALIGSRFADRAFGSGGPFATAATRPDDHDRRAAGSSPQRGSALRSAGAADRE